MPILQAILLGFVQGVGEFLPISSSAHLILVPWLFNWPDFGLGFDVALHWGTLFSVVLYFRKDVRNLIIGFWHSLFKRTRDFSENIYQRLSWMVLLATIPGAIIGKILEDSAESVFREKPLLIAVNLAVFGVLLWFIDRAATSEKNLDRTTFKDGLLIGLSQALAIVPGVSRSGSTMTMGRFLGIKRPDVARFSFLLSMPITFAAGVSQLPHFMEGVTLVQFLAGFISAAVFGFLSIRFLLKWLAKSDFKIFIVYRLLFAAIIIGVYWIRG